MYIHINVNAYNMHMYIDKCIHIYMHKSEYALNMNMQIKCFLNLNLYAYKFRYYIEMTCYTLQK